MCLPGAQIQQPNPLIGVSDVLAIGAEQRTSEKLGRSNRRKGDGLVSVNGLEPELTSADISHAQAIISGPKAEYVAGCVGDLTRLALAVERQLIDLLDTSCIGGEVVTDLNGLDILSAGREQPGRQQNEAEYGSNSIYSVHWDFSIMDYDWI